MYAKFIDCPECGRKFNENLRKCNCGWTNKFEKPTHDPDRHRCTAWSEGARCRKAGTMSHSVRESNDWVCWEHFNQ